MPNIVACSITVESTQVSCIVRVYRAEKHVPLWEKFAGRLEFKPAKAAAYNSGLWGYASLAGGASGIALLPAGCNLASSAQCFETQWLVLLRGVPADFFSLVSNEQSINGEGELLLTREKIRWAMWFHAA